MSVRFTNSSLYKCRFKNYCKAVPAQIQFESMGDCISKEYIITALPLASSYDPNNVINER
jgi:hypothetical protein